MTPAHRIIEKFGGTRPLATRLKLPASTVQSWKDSGFIPARRQQDILNAARESNIRLSPADFFEPTEVDRPCDTEAPATTEAETKAAAQ